MKLKMFVIAVIISLHSVGANAATNYMTGNRFFEILKSLKNPNSTNFTDNGIGIGYLEGIVDSSNAILNPSSSSRFCVPNGVSVNQLIDISYAFFEQNPHLRHYTADSLVAAALQKSFPCK
jgi:hypothetical protein